MPGSTTPAKLAEAKQTDASLSGNQQGDAERERMVAEIKKLKMQLAAADERANEQKGRRDRITEPRRSMVFDEKTLQEVAAKHSRNQEAQSSSSTDIEGTTMEAQLKKDRKIFDRLGPDAEGRVSVQRVKAELKACGLLSDDQRLRTSFAELKLAAAEGLTFQDFRVIKNESLLLDKAFARKLAIADFPGFTRGIEECYSETINNDAKHAEMGFSVATYIPQLGRVDPDQYGVAVCTVDGQRWSCGDSQVPFCIQSSSKPLTYAMALQLHGEEYVHKHLGKEPSGRGFNQRVLMNSGIPRGMDAHGAGVIYKCIPHNPCINAGAIMAASLVKGEMDEADRFDYVISMWKRLTGGKRVSFQNATYMGERGSADRNFCLGYMMQEEGAFPWQNGGEGNLIKTLESYFMYCSIEMDAEAMSIVAATLANGGVCPITNDRIFDAEHVKRTLTLIQSCGMYDASGQFAFEVGFPSKSGVSGVLCIIIPGVTGIATFSPRLDSLGNSARGIDFCNSLNSRFPFHQFANLEGCHSGKDITSIRLNQDLHADLWFAAANGDVQRLKQLVSLGVDVNIADYDHRSALHLASSNGHAGAVKFLLSVGATPTVKDLHGNTAVDDAARENRAEVQKILAGASTASSSSNSNKTRMQVPRGAGKAKLAVAQMFYNRLWCTSAIKRLDSPTGRIFHKADLLAQLTETGIDVTAIPHMQKALDALPEFFNNLCWLKATNECMRDSDDFTLSKALAGTLVVPNWPRFRREMEAVFNETAAINPGADEHPTRFYCPANGGNAETDVMAFGVCTVDGQQCDFGDADHVFTAQALARPVLYCMAQETAHGGVGTKILDEKVGREPAPSDATDLELSHGHPFNCMNMSGGIMTCALVEKDQKIAPRIKMDKLLGVWKDLTGGASTKVCEASLQDEHAHSNKHKCVTYMMRESKNLEPDADVGSLLDYYFMTNSIECNVKTMSILAATLAFGGVCPTTKKRIFEAETVKNCLCMMYSSGMDNYSGEFAFSCGLPAKGGMNGAVLVVVPNVMGACYYAPQVKELRGSFIPTRGIDLCNRLVQKFNFHFYDKISRGSGKMNPQVYDMSDENFYTIQLLNAASEGDLMAVKNLHSIGVDLDRGDYDLRTACHLAASKGQLDVLQYLALAGANPEPVDRWGNRPIDDAKRNGHQEAAAKLATYGEAFLSTS